MSSDSPDSLESSDSARPIGEIAQGPSAFEQFLDRNQKNIVMLTILVAVAAAAFVVYRGIASSKEHTAGAELNKAESLVALQSVIKDHKGTAAAGSAEILLAARQWAEGQQDAAIEPLKTFIAASPEHPARPTAQASLGSKLQTQGKLADAKKVFQDLADDPAARFMAPYALISLGDIAKASGEAEQAEKLYQKAKTDFPDSSYSNTISQRSAMLKAQMPVEIEAPPAPPATPPNSPTAPAAGSTIPSVPNTSLIGPESDVPEVKNPMITQPAAQPAETAPPAPETPATPPAPAPVQESPAAPRNDAGSPATPSKP